MKSINKYGLLNALLNIINNYEEESPKVVIAKFMLENFESIDTLNIFDAAEECSVSRASIRRFCQEIGFDNFKNLKEDKLEYSFYKENAKNNYIDFISSEINLMVDKCNIYLKKEKEKIAESILMADDIVFLVSDIYTSSCLEFQKQMILSGKLVRIISYNFEEKINSMVTTNSLLIVISISGGFLKIINNVIESLDCRKVIFTSLDDNSLTSVFDFVFHLGEGIPQKRTVYHTFAIEYCLDVILNEYQLLIQGT